MQSMMDFDSRRAYQWVMRNVLCCFYTQENEYENLIDDEGVITFVLDKERKTMEPIDVADALDHVGVDDESQLVLFFEGWRGCGCDRCKREMRRRESMASTSSSLSLSSPSALRSTRRSRSHTYQQLGQTEEDLQLEDMTLDDSGAEQEDGGAGSGKGKLKGVLRVKSVNDATFTRLRAPDSENSMQSLTSNGTRNRAVQFDNEINIAWTHKKAKYERSFYPPSMKEAKTRSDSIVSELQSVHRELFPEGGHDCFAVAIRKAKEQRQQERNRQAQRQNSGGSQQGNGSAGNGRS